MKVPTLSLLIGSVLITLVSLSVIEHLYAGLSRDAIKLIGAMTFWVAG